MEVFQSSPVAASLGETEFAPLARLFFDPLSEMIRLSAQNLDPSDQALYSINALLAMQAVLKPFAFTGARTELLRYGPRVFSVDSELC